MLVIVAVNGNKQLTSPEKGVVKEKKPKKHSTPTKSSNIDSDLKALEQRLFEHCSRLKALLVAKTPRQKTFQTDSHTSKAPTSCRSEDFRSIHSTKRTC